ncbi:YdiU family protein [Pontibacter sp. E15-1]|uniref:protein adenylyltransferase SelO n=1 Tax=Pontibacter sp. E15-1 TaxID=2919918 RepID=UPI001F4FD192|nr:YdiU family protein [Pontibacter sp. E15-1]MCJ8163406.1 YdiU family protein [Pontibacter sp. E15-1]
MQNISSIAYKNEFVKSFPGDESGEKQPRQTPGVLYSRVSPTPVSGPTLLAWSDALSAELGILKPATQEDIAVLAGNGLAPSMQPYAACYAGHQFGNWAGQLGDGRAITLGEHEVSPGNSWELQLKGAGPTPYSRRADGRAVLRSSVREYLMSEAMHYLRVPTTRALSLVRTGDQVLRDMFYNGNAAHEPGAIVLRTAPSFLRFGNFELLAARKELDNLRQLTDWTMARYFPHLQGGRDEKLLAWFEEVVERTARLMVEWLRVGFVHGVMNTDNMSVLGLTIDYGPFSFLDDYDPAFTPNTTDLPGRRYAFGQQHAIGYWNLGCLASALAPLLPDTEKLVATLETYRESFYRHYYAMMGNKLGLDEVRDTDKAFIKQFEETLATLKPDMTIFYQLLMTLPPHPADAQAVLDHFSESFYQTPNHEGATALFRLMTRYDARRQENICTPAEALQLMQESNPRFILRNYLLHQAIEELERGEDQLFRQLQEAIKTPYTTDADAFFAKRPEWASQKAGCSMLSCSS